MIKYMKTVTILLTAVMLMCCNVKSNSEDLPNGLWGGSGDYFVSGMHYHIVSNVNFGIAINLTKDSLECAYYRKQLSK